MWPTINQYIDSVANPFGLFRTLGEILPHRNQYGEVIFVSGNYSVVFRVDICDGAGGREKSLAGSDGSGAGGREKSFAGSDGSGAGGREESLAGSDGSGAGGCEEGLAGGDGSGAGGCEEGFAGSDGSGAGGRRTMALKCYTRPVDRLEERYSFLTRLGHPCITPCRLLPDELFVYSGDHSGEWMPVSVTPWIEGHTLLREVKRLCAAEGRGESEAKEDMAALAGKFDRMALWLLGQDFAHGDLKHDNIMVDNGGELRLIDFDGAYVPSLDGGKSPSLGSPAYQHPMRDENFFSRHLDDYSIAFISLNLHALSEDPSLFNKYNDSENLILNAGEVAAGQSALFGFLREKWIKEGSVWMLHLSDMLTSRAPQLPELKAVLGALCGEPVPLTGNYEIVDDSNPECVPIRRAGLYGYASTAGPGGITGQLLIPAVYTDAQSFSEGLAAVELRGRKMFVDLTGRNITDCSGYESISPLRERLARVSSGGKFGYIDRTGREVITPVYEAATNFRNGKAYACLSGKWLVIGRDGQKLTDKEFNSLEEARTGNT